MSYIRIMKRIYMRLSKHSASSKLDCLFGDIDLADSSFYRQFHNQLYTSSVNILTDSYLSATKQSEIIFGKTDMVQIIAEDGKDIVCAKNDEDYYQAGRILA